MSFEADYHFVGPKHAFTAHFAVTQHAPNPEGVIHGVLEGVVTEGWLKGNQVVGSYFSGPCGPGEGAGLSGCFHGTAEIERGSKNNN
ncbi:MAG: hypothetical protein AB9869_18770 [Verrucomicrobiia bacterium]